MLWDRQCSGSFPHTPTVGDVDGDGILDIVAVAATADGNSHLWVVRGDTGESLPGYPKELPRGVKMSASAILVDLHNYAALGYSMRTDREAFEDPALPPWLSTGPTGGGSSGSGSSSGNLSHPEPPAQGQGQGQAQGGGARRSLGLHIVVPSYDGHVYVIEGRMGCAERVDIGEHIYRYGLPYLYKPLPI